MNIAVIGKLNIKYINRVVTGKFNELNLIKDIMDIYTNKGIFKINFMTNITNDTNYIISISEKNEIDLNINLLENQIIIKMINLSGPYLENDNEMSIKYNKKLMYPIMQLLRKKEEDLNIYQINSNISPTMIENNYYYLNFKNKCVDNLKLDFRAQQLSNRYKYIKKITVPAEGSYNNDIYQQEILIFKKDGIFYYILKNKDEYIFFTYVSEEFCPLIVNNKFYIGEYDHTRNFNDGEYLKTYYEEIDILNVEII